MFRIISVIKKINETENHKEKNFVFLNFKLFGKFNFQFKETLKNKNKNLPSSAQSSSASSSSVSVDFDLPKFFNFFRFAAALRRAVKKKKKQF